jgi:DNA-binding GntR family transcriptional regulator
MDNTLRNVHHEHEMIFNAAMNGESLRAALALEMHIRTTPDLIVKALKQSSA